jgi:hypothetical protein
MRPLYYLNERLVDRKEVPSHATFIRRIKREEKWGGKNHKIIELYYETRSNRQINKSSKR